MSEGEWQLDCYLHFCLAINFVLLYVILFLSLHFIAAFSFVIDQGCYNLYLYIERQYIKGVCNDALQTVCVVGQSQNYTDEYLNMALF